MMFNATFNNISVISWQSVLLVEEMGVPGENHQPVTSHWQILSHNIAKYTPPWTGIKLTALVVIGTDSTGSCKSKHHMTMTACISHWYLNLTVKRLFSFTLWCNAIVIVDNLLLTILNEYQILYLFKQMLS